MAAFIVFVLMAPILLQASGLAAFTQAHEMKSMIWVTDTTGSVTCVNPEWEKLTGQPALEALGAGWLAKVHPDDRAVVVQSLKKANQDREQISMMYRLSFRQGDFRWVKSSILPSLLPGSGELIGLMGTVTLAETDADFFAHTSNNDNSPIHVVSDDSAGRRGKAYETAIEGVADHVIQARKMAETAQEPVITGILDVALMEIGFCLAKIET